MNGNLTIEQGTKIKFSKDSYLIVKGALETNGTIKKPIIFTSLDERSYWSGVYVLNANKVSKIENTKFLNLNAINSGPLNLTGAISFYNSDVDIKNVIFENSISEDALNIVSSKFLIENSEFKNCKSDAFDSDFSDGKILNSFFHNIQGDAVDFSGSNVQIDSLITKNIYDKSVSVGEASNVNIFDSIISNSRIGIATKDGSITSAKNIQFKDNELYDVMTFFKKSFYGAPILKLENENYKEKIKTISQSGTFLYINKEQINNQNLNVAELYL